MNTPPRKKKGKTPHPYGCVDENETPIKKTIIDVWAEVGKALGKAIRHELRHAKRVTTKRVKN